MSSILTLEHSIDITIPFKTFERNFVDFRDKHELGNRLVHATNSDGKFRLELKENEDEEAKYLLRVSGWKRKQKRPNVDLQRIYVGDRLTLDEPTADLLDLIEVWAIDHRGSFYFKYVDFNEPLLDAYNIIRGLEKIILFTDNDLQKLLHTYGQSEVTER
jgi:hypothetical protein